MFHGPHLESSWPAERTDDMLAQAVKSTEERWHRLRGSPCGLPLSVTGCYAGSDVVVQHKLERVWSQCDLLELLFALEVDIGLDQVCGEDTTLEQEFVVAL